MFKHGARTNVWATDLANELLGRAIVRHLCPAPRKAGTLLSISVPLTVHGIKHMLLGINQQSPLSRWVSPGAWKWVCNTGLLAPAHYYLHQLLGLPRRAGHSRTEKPPQVACPTLLIINTGRLWLISTGE